MAQFYVAVWPLGGEPDAETFFSLYIAAPLIIGLYGVWKAWSWTRYPAHRRLWVPISEINVHEGMRLEQQAISGEGVPDEVRRSSITEMQAEKKTGPKAFARRMVGGLF
ncbi:hypothetical protein N0V90_005213 [Kalmusia sp. IMI 367209]|nr:hypothetical protein N0V90_005213 [Kalmusia sp. IMI 367209]